MKSRNIFILLFFIFVSCTQNNTEDKSEKLDTVTLSATKQDTPTAENLDGFAAVLQRKKQNGIDLYALGQEPGWSLDMDFESNFNFSSYEGSSFIAPAVQPKIDGGTSTYISKTKGGELSIAVIKGDCFDVMSGQKFTHSVTINIKTGTGSKTKTFKGCGAMLN